MSQENVEIVRTTIEAFNGRDWDGALSDAAPDFVIDLSRAVGPVRGVFRRDQVLGLLSDFGAHWESFRIEPHECIEAGEQVVVP